MRIAFAIMCSLVALSTDAIHLTKDVEGQGNTDLSETENQAEPVISTNFDEKDEHGNDSDDENDSKPEIHPDSGLGQADANGSDSDSDDLG